MLHRGNVSFPSGNVRSFPWGIQKLIKASDFAQKAYYQKRLL